MSVLREEFIKMNVHFKAKESVLRYMYDKTFKVDIIRVNLDFAVYSESIIATPNFLYIPNQIVDYLDSMNINIEEFESNLIRGYKAEYTFKDDVDNIFDLASIYSKLSILSKNNKTNMYVKSWNKYNYFWLLLSSDPKENSLVSRFQPLWSEYETYKLMMEDHREMKFPLSTSKNLEELKNIMEDTEDELNETNNFYQIIFTKKKEWKEEDTASLMTDFKSSLMTNLNENLTWKKFQYWNRSRHNIFGQVCMKLIGLDNLDKMDVSMTNKYNYYGSDHNKTPDMVDDDNNLLVDFAVTTSNAGAVREKKIKKYSDLAFGLSKHLKKDFSAEAIVWKINNRKEYQIPDLYRHIKEDLDKSEEMDFLYQVHLAMTMKNDYEKFRTMSENENDDEYSDLENKLNLYKNLIKKKMKNKMKYSNIKTSSIDDSRDKERGGIKKKVYLRETKFNMELKNMEMFDHHEHTEKLTSLLITKLKCKDHPKYFKEILDPDREKLKMKIDKDFIKMFQFRKNTLMNPNFKIPKLFKFPLFRVDKSNMPLMYLDSTPNFYNAEAETSDGTIYINSDLDYSMDKEKEKSNKLSDYNSNGIGIDKKLDSIMFEELFEYMISDSEDFFENFMPNIKMAPELDDMLKTNLWSMVSMVSDLYFNISYLEGRRHVFNKSEGHTVFKNFGSYMLIIKKGSKLTSQKQIRFKVIIPKKSMILTNPKLTHSMKEFEFDSNLVITKWLTASITDIRHFLKIKEVSMALMSNLLDKEKEMNRGMTKMYNLKSKEVAAYMMILMENKRGTSTSSQLNRYLVHSITSYISNKSKIIDDINSDPIWSYGESFIRISQMNWFKLMIDKSLEYTYERVSNMTSVKNDYDKFKMVSFFNTEKEVEFSIMMDEMYICNLFDKESGFTSHRQKQIIKKSEEAEMHFQNVKKMEWSKGNVEDLNDFMNSKDELHMFDKNTVVAATRYYFNNKVNKVKMQESIMKSLCSTIDNAMMMTSSLVSGPYESECLEFSKNINKTRSFLAIFEEVNKLSTNVLSEMCNRFDNIDAIFALFPKAQIGGPREILIQAVLLRIMVKFLETVSKEMCTTHDKEMLTKNNKRSEIQSDTMAEMRETMRILKAKNQTSVFFSVNADASKWAPGFVMENFMYFINEWDIPDELKNLLLTIVMSFSSKKMLVPEELKRKWENKDKMEKEYSDAIENFREQSYMNTFVVEFCSGMGQGMFHYLSSFYHCIMNDYTENMISKVLSSVNKTLVKEKCMLSSDDETRMVLMLFKKGYTESEESLKNYIIVFDLVNRLCNIHINWKKSGLNFIITEFNSLFSVGKRMTWATIKDLYNSNSIPDLTSPEEAVNFMMSNIRRCLEHGVYLTTIDVLMQMARNQLIQYYRISPAIIKKLKDILNCSEDYLPYNLGFLPLKMPVETLIYGSEVHMFDPNNSKELMKYYNNIYTAKNNKEDKKKKGVVPFSEESKGKFWFELPTRMDKQLKEIKKDFFDNKINMNFEDIMESMNMNSMNVNLMSSDHKSYKQFVKEFFVGMNRKYEFQETMVVHSLVRALQLSRSKGVVYPKSEKMVEIEKNYNELKDKVMGQDPELIDFVLVKSKLEDLEVDLDYQKHDLVSFASSMMNLDKNDTEESSIYLYKGLSIIAMNHYTIKNRLNEMNVSTKYKHPTMRTIRFYSNDIGSSIKSKDLINHLFDPNHSSSNLILKLFEDLVLNFKNLDRKLIYENPFKFIEKFMNYTDMPFKSFKDYIDLNYKSMKFIKINMISDFYDSGNMKENLMNMYMNRTNPSYIYELKSDDTYKDQKVLEFLTNISLNLNYDDPYLREDMMNITTSDNKVTKAMKLSSLSKNDWETTQNMSYQRVEYKVKKFKGVKYEMWTNLSTLIRAIHRGKNLDVYIYSNNDIDTNLNNRYLMSAFIKDMNKYEVSGMKVNYMTRARISEIYNVAYMISEIKFKTSIKRYMTKWMMNMQVTASRNHHFKFEDYSTAEFTMLTDTYTVDNKSLMNMKIKDSMDDEITIKEFLTDIPDIETLDHILLKNGWLKDIKMKENQEVETQDKYTIESMNESFGVKNMKDAIINLVGSTKVLNTENYLNMESPSTSNWADEMNEIEDTIDLSSFNIRNLADAMNKSLEQTEEDSSDQDESYMNERASLIKIMDYMITESVTMTIDINRQEMKRYINSIRTNMRSMNTFHNYLFWHIRDIFNYNISDVMAVIIYNIILKNHITVLDIQPISHLKKIPKMPKSNKMVQFLRLKSNDEDIQETMRIFD